MAQKTPHPRIYRVTFFVELEAADMVQAEILAQQKLPGNCLVQATALSSPVKRFKLGDDVYCFISGELANSREAFGASYVLTLQGVRDGFDSMLPEEVAWQAAQCSGTDAEDETVARRISRVVDRLLLQFGRDFSAEKLLELDDQRRERVASGKR